MVTPDGIISSLAGPVEGSRGDCYLFVHTALEQKIRNFYEQNQTEPDDRIYSYGDAAYTGSMATMGLFRRPRGGELNDDQAWATERGRQNETPSNMPLGMVQTYLALPSYHLQNRVGSQPVAATYLRHV